VVADAAQSGHGPAEAAVSLTAGLITWPALTVAHAGDCRAYLWRDGHLEQLTADDTVAERVVEREIPDPADIAERSAALTNVIGAATGELDVHVCEREVELGDQLVICSGPLARNLGALEISDIVGSSITAATAARRLVDRAAGGESLAAIVLRAQDIT
jgi:protein phosphatase